jgi:hypothetical protein
MTITEATGKLFKFFEENDSFSFPKDLKNLYLTVENEKEASEAVLMSLDKFVASNLVKKSNTDPIWVLEKRFSDIEQSLSISGATAAAISETVNYLDIDYKSTPLNITEKDIHLLLSIISKFSESGEKE